MFAAKVAEDPQGRQNIPDGAWRRRLARFVLAGGVALALPPSAVTAGADDAAADITAALNRWMFDFNAQNSAAVCRLFARDLRYDVQGLPEQRYRDLCDRLHRSLAEPTRRLRYGLDVKEILVSGDLAVARLVWRLTTSRPGRPDVKTTEHGLDVFRRQPDGSWQIIRFIAYDAR